MTTIPDLMRPILERPWDDGPRLIYADAIEESDPNRAEYIRCQIHGGPEWLMVRLAANAEWSKKPEGIDHIVWRRSWPDSVTLPLARLVGGPCGRCEGRGSEELFPYLNCKECRKTGRTPSLAPVLGQ